MSDTEREAFEAWFGPTFLDTPVWEPVRHGYNNHAVHMAWKGWQARARRSTTTEARAPLSDEQIGDLWEASALDAGSGVRRSVRFARSVIAARAPAPPSDVRQLIQTEIKADKFALAGPPAPSVPDSVSVDETEAKASAMQRPA